jgi:hypothetical protein
MINKQSPPTLEQRIVSILANANAGSEALAELIEEVEIAARACVETAEVERTRSLDLVQCPDPHQARERIAAAELAGDRLRTQLPKLRGKLSTALMAESRERWFADYRRVRQQLDEAVALFETYSEHAQAIVQMFALAEQVDKEVSRINGSAPDGIGHRLKPVELEARNLDRFTRDNPSLAATVELRDWDNSGKKLWPLTSSGAFAAMVAGMTVPHPGADWSTAEVREQRRAEVEKSQRRQAEFFQEQTAVQEDRLNREERERFQQQQRRG